MQKIKIKKLLFFICLLALHVWRKFHLTVSLNTFVNSIYNSFDEGLSKSLCWASCLILPAFGPVLGLVRYSYWAG